MFSIFNREFKSLFCGYRAYSFTAIFAICYLAIRMIYNYTLLYDKVLGLLNQEYILALLPAAFALAAPVITFSIYEEERKKNVFSFLRSLPLSGSDIFWGKYLSRFALFGVVYLCLILIDILLGFYSGAPVFTVIYSAISYVIICAAILSLNIFFASVFKNKFVALGVGYGVSAILIALTFIRYIGSHTLLKILEPISVFGTYSSSVFGVVDVSYLFLWISFGGLFTYLSFSLIKKETRL